MQDMNHWHSVSFERFLKPLQEHSEQLGGLLAPIIDSDSSLQEVLKLFLSSKCEALYLKNENSILVEGDIFKKIRLFQNEGVDLQSLKAIDFAQAQNQCLDQEATILDGLRQLYQSTNPFFLQNRGEDVYLFSVRDILQFFIIEFSKELEDFHLSAGKMRTHLGVQAEDYFLDTSKQDNKVGGDLFLLPLSRLLMGNFIRENKESTLNQTLHQMIDKNLSCVLIMEFETILQGIITYRDLFRSFLKFDILSWDDFNQWTQLKAPTVMTAHPDTLGIRHSLAHGLCLIHQGGYRQFIIVDEERVPLGVITLSQMLRFIARYLPDAPAPAQS